ncbi:hypothetical protein CBC_0206 [Clostridium botulinum C str. Eklund]|nr:hypothetical protein CBC_0206 [Clostridium botulinum C str. Eklund]
MEAKKTIMNFLKKNLQKIKLVVIYIYSKNEVNISEFS